MTYFTETVKMLALFCKGGKNAIIDFFVQLSKIRNINLDAIVVAIESKHTTFEKTIEEAVPREEWMQHITLNDIRTHVMFTFLKDNDIVINSTPYVDPDCHDAVFLSLDRTSTIGTNIQDLGILIETAFYIRQIYIIKHNRHLINSKWDMFHQHITNFSLAENIKQIYDNLKTIVV
jgi:hypothetical protein